MLREAVTLTGCAGKTAYWTLWFFCASFQPVTPGGFSSEGIKSFFLFPVVQSQVPSINRLIVIASRNKRRSEPGFLDLPLRGTKSWEYYNGFVADAPRNDDPMISP
jgi:hypothetical protein